MNLNKDKYILQDISLILLSIIVSFLMIKTNLLSGLLSSTRDFYFVGSFIAGMFFTSAFSTAPAIVTLGQIAKHDSLFITAFAGSLGAILGDFFIFSFIRDRLSEHLVLLMKHERWWKRVHMVFKLRYFRWLTFLLGGIILASPLPDELGIGILGSAKMKTYQFIQISFVFNFIGIFIIGTLARSL